MKLLCRIMAVVWLSCCLVRPASGQPAGTISGTVYDSLSKEPLVSATVLVQELQKGRFTNADGYFILPQIPFGTYHLRITYLGYRPKIISITVSPQNPRRVLKIFLVPDTLELGEVVVEAEREIEKREVIISRVHIPLQQLTSVRIASERDIFRTLQYLPGILSSSQVSSGLYIRGGSPDQNLILLDGATVYNPSHAFGFYSTFNADAIKDVQLYKGGFPAEYGDRMSAVLDITQKEGNKTAYHGKLIIGTLSSQGSVEGPIPLLPRSSFFLAGRRTYLEIVKPFLPEDPENPIPDFYFYDLNGKITMLPGDDDKVSLGGFLTRDIFRVRNAGTHFTFGILNRVASLRWAHVFTPQLLLTALGSASYYENRLDGSNFGFDFQIKNFIQDLAFKVTTEYYPTDRLSLKAGGEYHHYRFQFYQNFTGKRDTVIQEGSGRFGTIHFDVPDETFSIFLQGSYKLTDLLLIQAGIRSLTMGLRDLTVVMPRLALRYQFHPDFSVKLLWGIYKQYFYLAYQPNFSFFDTWLPTDPLTNPPTAQHYILSVEGYPLPNIKTSVDVYYKPMKHIAEFNRFSISGNSTRDIFLFGDGIAYGIEIFAQKKTGKLTGWVGYAYGYVEWQIDSLNNGKPFNPRYDRRHDFKIVLNYQISRRWEAAASFFFQSGQPYTPATSRFQSRFPGENPGRGVVIPADLYSLRLPPSHQLNLSIRYHTTIFDLPAIFSLDIYNVYSRRDIFARIYDTTSEVTTVTDVKLLPIVPSFSVEVEL